MVSRSTTAATLTHAAYNIAFFLHQVLIFIAYSQPEIFSRCVRACLSCRRPRVRAPWLSAVSRAFTPVLAKHSKSFSLIDCISVGVDRMQRNFEPMRKQVEAWQRSELTDVTAKVVIYEAFIGGRLEAPKHLARTVHDKEFLKEILLRS